MKPSARSLILDLLSTLRRGSMPVRALVAAAALFDISENSLRVALARLTAEGGVLRDERGRYRLGARTTAIRAQVSTWRKLDERLRPWRGDWVCVYRPPTRARGAGHRRQHQALRFLGFRPLERGLELRPDNLAGGVVAVREQLADLGLSHDVPVFSVCELDASRADRARRLWDDLDLAGSYVQSCRELAESSLRLGKLSNREAMVESFLVGGRTMRKVALDPLLPEPLVPAEPRDALFRALREYDHLGRIHWARFLEEFDVPHVRAPMRTHVSDEVDRLPEAATR